MIQRGILWFAIALFFLAACKPGPSQLQNQTIESLQNQTIENASKINGEASAQAGEAPGEVEKAEEKAEETLPEGLVDNYPSDLPRKRVVEGELINFPNLKAVDPDGDQISYKFTSPLNEKGEWQTKEGDAGVYKVTITASDGKVEVSQDVVLIVLPKNRPPKIELESEVINAKEGSEGCIAFKAKDPEGKEVKVRFEGYVKSECFTPGYEDAGEHKAWIIASDSELETKVELKIVVEEVNRAPKLEVSDVTVREGELVKLSPLASDPDGDEVKLTFGEPLNEKGEWQTAIGDAGTYQVEISASDGKDTIAKKVRIVVEKINRPPALKLLDNPISVNEGEKVCIAYEATDPDGEEVRVTFSGWMTEQCKTTGYEDSGTYEVTLTASDGKEETVVKAVVKVNDVNRPPVFESGSFS